jgi:hypothetical protein
MWEAGFLDVFQGAMQRFSPMQRIGRDHLIASQVVEQSEFSLVGCAEAVWWY